MRVGVGENVKWGGTGATAEWLTSPATYTIKRRSNTSTAALGGTVKLTSSDANANGEIDRIKITFSRTTTEYSFSWLAVQSIKLCYDPLETASPTTEPSTAPTSAPTRLLGALVSFTTGITVSEHAASTPTPVVLLTVNADAAATGSEVITVVCIPNADVSFVNPAAITITSASAGVLGKRSTFEITAKWDALQIASRSTIVECTVTSSLASKTPAMLSCDGRALARRAACERKRC
jgi:hypothetical protein